MLNKNGIEFIQSWEGLWLKAYPDPGSALAKACRKAGISHLNYKKLPNWDHYLGKPWTIGYGDTKDVVEGMVITRKEALARLLKRLESYEKEVKNICNAFKFSPTGNQFAAMVSFAYNAGSDDLYKAVRVAGLKQSDPATLQKFVDILPLYCHSDNEAIAGLQNRRRAEGQLFLRID